MARISVGRELAMMLLVRRVLLSVVLSGLFCVGCGASSSEVVRTRHAREWRCPEASVQVEELGGGAWRADGCDHTATYYCEVNGAGMDNNCILESARERMP